MCSDVLSYHYWECDESLILTGPFHFKKNSIWGSSSGNLRPSFFFPPPESFGLHIDSNLYTLLGLFQTASKPGGQRHELKRTLTVLIIFSITSDDKPDLQGHCMASLIMQCVLDMPNASGWTESNCWNVPPTFMKGTPAETRGTAVLCLDQSIIVWGYLFRMLGFWVPCGIHLWGSISEVCTFNRVLGTLWSPISILF